MPISKQMTEQDLIDLAYAQGEKIMVLESELAEARAQICRLQIYAAMLASLRPEGDQFGRSNLQPGDFDPTPDPEDDHARR